MYHTLLYNKHTNIIVDFYENVLYIDLDKQELVCKNSVAQGFDLENYTFFTTNVGEIVHDSKTGVTYYIYGDKKYKSGSKIPTMLPDLTESIIKIDKLKQLVTTPIDELNEANIEKLSLDKLKQLKINELNYRCSQTILGYFKYKPVNSEKTYLFSYDSEAQSNFTDAFLMVIANAFQSTLWTAHTVDTKEVVRITLVQEDFQQLVAVITQHKNGNIAKFRDELMPRVQNATTKEEVLAIIW